MHQEDDRKRDGKYGTVQLRDHAKANDQSQKYQITEKTTKILEIQYYGGEENGRDN